MALLDVLRAAKGRLRASAPRLHDAAVAVYRRSGPLHRRVERAKLRRGVAELRATIEAGAAAGHLAPAVAARLRRYADELRAEVERG